ncbi:unnamed protein product [Urochloa humidicola]
MVPPQPPELMPELVEEILLRVAPDEPAALVRTALVCKFWRRILSHRDFLHHYREFHPSPPLLGYTHKDHKLYRTPTLAAGFVPTSTASPVFMAPLGCRGWSSASALDCRHGRVLIHVENPIGKKLIVWYPLTGGQQHLSMPTGYPAYYMYYRYTPTPTRGLCYVLLAAATILTATVAHSLWSLYGPTKPMVVGSSLLVGDRHLECFDLYRKQLLHRQ